MDGILKSVVITYFPFHYNFRLYPICNLAQKIITELWKQNYKNWKIQSSWTDCNY